MQERAYQRSLIRELRRMFPGCIILKNDPNYLQGVPDLTILFEDKWAVLEVKASADAADQPNQRHYIRQMGEMSFAAFISPEIEEDVLDALQQALRGSRAARVS